MTKDGTSIEELRALVDSMRTAWGWSRVFVRLSSEFYDYLVEQHGSEDLAEALGADLLEVKDHTEKAMLIAKMPDQDT